MASTNIVFTFSVDSTQVTDIVDTLAKSFGYQATIKNAEGQDIPNPQTKQAFIKQEIGKLLKTKYVQQKANDAGDTATATAKTTAEAVVIA